MTTLSKTKTFLAIALSSAVLLGACESAEQKEQRLALEQVADMPGDPAENLAALKAERLAAEQEAARIAAAQNEFSSCPVDQVINDVSTYPLDLPAEIGSADAFHAAMAAKEGVTTTESGLQYSVFKSGNPKGPQPVPTNTVRVNYHGIFPDGTKFDSSYDRGQDIEFGLNRVIRGWTEGVGLMRPCDAWTLYIPSDLAYGPNGRPGIPGGASLVFHVQLLEVK